MKRPAAIPVSCIYNARIPESLIYTQYLFSFLPPLISFLPVSLYTVRPLITDAQTEKKTPIYKYIPQLRS
jgi:hypothetical protein